MAVEVYQESAPVDIGGVAAEPSARSTESAGPSHAQWRADVATRSNEMVHVVIELADSSNKVFDQDWAAAESKFDRSVLINNRVAELNGLQATVKNVVKSFGGRINGTFWSSNSFSAEIPVEVVAVLEARPDVIGVWNTVVVDLCTASGVPEVIKAADGWNYLWKRIRVFDQWRFHNTCPWVRVGTPMPSMA